MPTIQFVNFSEDAPKASKSVSLDEINSKEDLVKLDKETIKPRKEEITFVDALTGKPVKKINVELGKWKAKNF